MPGLRAGPSWRVVATRRHKERFAEASLRQLGVGTYLPLLLQWPRPAVGTEVGPMFPGYLFTCVKPCDMSAVDRTPGVRGLGSGVEIGVTV